MAQTGSAFFFSERSIVFVSTNDQLFSIASKQTRGRKFVGNSSNLKKVVEPAQIFWYIRKRREWSEKL